MSIIFRWLNVIFFIGMSLLIECSKDTSTATQYSGLRIVNNSSQEITSLYVFPTGESSRGINHLAQAIMPGESYTLENIPQDIYDLIVVAGNSGSLEVTRNNVELIAGQMEVWTITDNDFPSNSILEVTNNSSYTITQLYVSPSTDTIWGLNCLENYTIEPGANHRLSGILPGVYDMKASENSGRTTTRMGVTFEIGETVSWVVTDDDFSGAARLVVVNNSSYTIGYLFVSPSSDSTWGSNQLGTFVISPGDSFTIENIPDGIYDFLAVTLDDQLEAGRSMVVMESGAITTWTLTSSDFSIAKIRVASNDRESLGKSLGPYKAYKTLNNTYDVVMKRNIEISWKGKKSYAIR